MAEKQVNPAAPLFECGTIRGVVYSMGTKHHAFRVIDDTGAEETQQVCLTATEAEALAHWLLENVK